MDAAKKHGYALLKFPQIADTQGYAVAEAHYQLLIGTDDEAARQLDLAVKLAEKEQRPKRGRSESGYGGGYGRGGRGGRHAHANDYGSQGGSWQGPDAYMYPQPPVYSPAQMPAAPSGWPFAAPPGPGPAQVVKGMGGAMHPSAAKAGKACYSCGGLGHFSYECSYGKGGPPTGM